MKSKKIMSYFLCILIVTQIILFSKTTIVKAISKTRITYSIKGSTTVGETFDVDVKISGLENLYGASLDFVYDTSLIEVLDIKKGNLLNDNRLKDITKKINNGKASLASVLIGDQETISGLGTLFTITAKALKPGTISLLPVSNNSEMSTNRNNIRINLADNFGQKLDYDSDFKVIRLTPSTSAKVTSLITDKPSSAILGSKINITANAEGGSNLLYKFYVKENGKWTILRDYESSNSVLWNPSHSGNYDLSVYIKDKNSNKDVDDCLSIKYTIGQVEPVKPIKPVKVISIKSGLTSPQAKNTPITFTANAEGGSNLLYKFYVKENGKWQMKKDYSNSNSFTWTPSKSGEYFVSVYVKDKNSKKDVDDCIVMKYIITDTGKIKPVKAISLNSNLNGPQSKNTSITFTANAEGGSNLLYKFYVKENGKWNMKQDYSNSNSFTWTPSKSGEYFVSVYVKDKNSKKDVDDCISIKYNITKNNTSVKVTNLAPSVPSPKPKNSYITFYAQAEGSSNILYRFYVKESGKWNMKQDYSNDNGFTWHPNTPGKYYISVYVKDKNSNKDVDDCTVIEYTIN